MKAGLLVVSHFSQRFILVLITCLLMLTSAAARDRIQIVGSSTVYPFTTVVAEKHGSQGDMKTPVVESTGTGGGIKLFCAGIGGNFPDISNASRAMKGSEFSLCKKNGVGDIVELVIGSDGIALANSVKGEKLDLSLEQIWLAMAQKGPKPMRWNEIDPTLPATKIMIFTPPPTSGTRDTFNSLVMGKGCPASVKDKNKKDCQLLREDGAVIEAGENDALIVQKLNANVEALGIFGFSYLDSNRDKIQASAIEGVEISIDTIQSSEYPIARPLYLYVKKAHVGVIPGVEEFLEEYVSDAAIGEDGYLVDVGLVPLPASRKAEMKQRVSKLESFEPRS